MTRNRFRITSVDLYGYNGRDHHPSLSDVGLAVTAIKMDARFVHPEGYDEVGEILAGNVNGVTPAMVLPFLSADGEELEGACYIETCYTCVTADGRLLEMMDFELEAL